MGGPEGPESEFLPKMLRLLGLQSKRLQSKKLQLSKNES